MSDKSINLEALYLEMLKGPPGPRVILTTQRALFDLLHRAGKSVDEMREIALELSEMGRWENEGIHVHTSGGGVLIVISGGCQ